MKRYAGHLYSPHMLYNQRQSFLLKGKTMNMNFKTIGAAAALCMLTAVAQAQTPAQDAGRVTADKAAVDAAKAVVQADNAQLANDQNAQKAQVLPADVQKLNADKQTEANAEVQLNADMQRQSMDETRFNGPPPAAATTAAPTAGGTTGSVVTPPVTTATAPAAPVATTP